MTDSQLLIGSLSNDLFRIASLAQRGSINAAKRFLNESKRWASPLSEYKEDNVDKYILDIAIDVSTRDENDVSLKSAEQYLMYGILLQNYTFHSNRSHTE